MIESSQNKIWEREMAWDIVDYSVFSAMLLGVVFVYALLRRKVDNNAYRLALGVGLAAAFILVWVNGAVGIIGDENNDANMMLFAVLGVAIIGAFIARFRPTGMARAMYATALAQSVVATIALIAGLGSTAPGWPGDVLFMTVFFVTLWLLSGWLFSQAARRDFHTVAKPGI
jgi:hypothetical protein